MINNRAARRQIGAALADQIPKLCSLECAARQIGVTKSLVQRIERDALWKIFIRMRE